MWRKMSQIWTKCSPVDDVGGLDIFGVAYVAEYDFLVVLGEVLLVLHIVTQQIESVGHGFE